MKKGSDSIRFEWILFRYWIHFSTINVKSYIPFIHSFKFNFPVIQCNEFIPSLNASPITYNEGVKNKLKMETITWFMSMQRKRNFAICRTYCDVSHTRICAQFRTIVITILQQSLCFGKLHPIILRSTAFLLIYYEVWSRSGRWLEFHHSHSVCDWT